MNILLVDDDTDSRAGVAEFLREMGHSVTECCDGEEAWAAYGAGNYPMVLSDIKMPGISGIDLLRQIAAGQGRKADVVLFTGHGDMQTAIEALRAGAYDYLLKPINVAELVAITERISEHQSLIQENKILTERFGDEVRAATEESRQEIVRLKHILSQVSDLDNVGFFSQEMCDIASQAQKYHHDRSIPILIEGETGTGKEIIARIIHHGEMREQAPFVDVNCAALTANLFESELFGYESGAFTGGLTKGQKGKLDLAQGGTLFLDEVGEIPLELQGKLLRAIQEREFYRVGGLKKIKTDVRIICATNARLEQRVEQGTFRRDLFYRLKVGRLHILPLRERKKEILPLAEMFLRQFALRKKRRFQRISQSAADILLTHNWPGNVRELKNAIELAVFLHDDLELKPGHLGELFKVGHALTADAETTVKVFNPLDFDIPAAGFSLEEYIDRIVRQALKKFNGNKTAAARYLDISRRSLYCRLERKRDSR